MECERPRYFKTTSGGTSCKTSPGSCRTLATSSLNGAVFTARHRKLHRLDADGSRLNIMHEHPDFHWIKHLYYLAQRLKLCSRQYPLFTLLDLCVSSLRRGMINFSVASGTSRFGGMMHMFSQRTNASDFKPRDCLPLPVFGYLASAAQLANKVC